jgi:NADH-quinone oxidoreductase subunit K
MNGIPLEHGLLLAGGLFLVGLGGLLFRRNLIFTIMSLEIMLNAAGLAFVLAGAHHGQPDGQVMFLLVLAIAAAEVAVGLAIVLRIRRGRKTLDADAIDQLRG